MNACRGLPPFLAVSALIALRVEAAPAAVGTWKAPASVTSQYMFRGVRLGGPAFQPSKGWRNWLNQGLAPKVANAAAVGRYAFAISYAVTY